MADDPTTSSYERLRSVLGLVHNPNIEIEPAIILSMFNSLSDDDKVKILLGVSSEDRSPATTGVASVGIEEELSTIEEINAIEMIRLKTWLVRTAIVIVLIAVLVGLGLYLYSDPTSLVTTLKFIVEMLKIAFS